MIISEISLKIRRHRSEILIGITGFVLGIVYMYFDSRAYYEPKFLSNRKFYWKVITKYQDSLEVSNAMVGNSYDTFYTISKCSTKAGCDFLDTALKLHDLNKEREELKEKSEALDEEVKLLMESVKVQ
ncbi:hypothetical protein A3E66_04685 [Candidatus Daviesbacteria bacterium RIFCSPHIGHO2_12_FULL_37_16]|uniref:Uncharacterized protein n=2 Tax=Candidatus Daviesiibacteriota TaxID=1752718 RepID=A0A0G0ETL1_9BACT|nr:MAG: hypothetical protein US19_C0018G0024 [Candidatus Daviesbacteria bacterium GW2011_GWB1_36_5]OGE34876.1 MAG: hypothetical protein A3E66_04685 [Candidatus Daviesbacteria bacterium RIFCSPHIGHO2_12_FULL_37_16]